VGSPTATFANRTISDMLQDTDWVHVAYTFISPKENIKILQDYLHQLLATLEAKITRVAATQPSKDWYEFVKCCSQKGGSNMSAYVSREVKAYMSMADSPCTASLTLPLRTYRLR